MSITVGVGVPGAVGLNVTSRPGPSAAIPVNAPPTAVHWLTDGHATPCRMNPEFPVSTTVGVGVPGAVGLNVACRPLPPTAVH